MKTLDDLLWLWDERREAGKPVTPEELCPDDPKLLEELKWNIRALEAVDARFGVISTANKDSTFNNQKFSPIAATERVLVSSEYRIDRLHASGGLGSVYLATDPVLNRQVAIKFPRWEKLTTEQAARFEREARITGKLDHPGIIPVHALQSRKDDRPFYVMRFIDGQTLQAKIQELHPDRTSSKSAAFFETFEFRQLLRNFINVCNIVAYAHEQGVIHRDIKPANIILGPFGEVLLLDWGLAKVVNETADEILVSTTALDAASRIGNSFETQAGQILGTPAFASPEQLMGLTDLIDCRSDMFSLGATLFVLLTGSFATGNLAFHEYLDRLKSGRTLSVHEQNPSISKPLEAICRHAMSIKVEDRYPDALSLARDLELYLAGEAVSVFSDSPLVRLGRWIRRRPGAAAACTATILVATIAGVTGSVMLNHKNQELRTNNSKLEIAINDSHAANEHALQTLRTLFDDFITQKLSTQTELSDADRSFLKGTLEQYESFAQLKGDSVESRAVRAEGIYQSGVVLGQLSEEVPARRHFEQAAEIYQQLVNETGQARFRVKLSAVSESLALSLLDYGELEAAQTSCQRGIETLESGIAASSTEADPETQDQYARLLQLRAEISILNGRWDDALAAMIATKNVLEHLQSSSPNSNQAQSRLASCYRALSDACEHVGDFREQDEYSRKAVDLYQQLLANAPNDPKLCRGFAWSCYDRSYAHEFFARNKIALEQMTEAVGVASQLTEKFPLIIEYKDLLASMRFRRAAVHSRLDHYRLAEQDLKLAILSLEATSSNNTDGSQSFRQLMAAVRKLGLLQDSYGRFPDAEATLRQALKHAASFSASFPETAVRSWELQTLTYDLAMVLSHQDRHEEGAATLLSWLRSVTGKNNVGNGNLVECSTQLQAHCGVVKIHLQKNAHADARKELDVVIAFLADMAKQRSDDRDALADFAEIHLQISGFERDLGNFENAERHETMYLEFLTSHGSASAESPARQVRMTEGLIALAEHNAEYGDHDSAIRNFGRAEECARQAVNRFPADLSVQKTLGDVLWTRGRFLCDRENYSEALKAFDDAVVFDPQSTNRSIRSLCLSQLNDARAMPDIQEVAASRTIFGQELVELVLACGTIVLSEPSADLRDQAIGASTQLLEHAVADGCALKPRQLKRLRSSREFKELCKHHDLANILDKLDLSRTGSG